MNKEELLEPAKLTDREDEKKEQTATGKTITDLIELLWSKRRYFFISVPLAFIVGIALSLSMPKYYVVGVKLAPEMSNAAGNTGSLGSIMKNLGMSRSMNTGEADAILPNLYPDLMNSQLFLVSLFDIPVVSKNGQISCTYYEYLAKHQKFAWWDKVIGLAYSLIPRFESDEDKSTQDATAQTDKRRTGTETADSADNTLRPLTLTKKQTSIMKAISQNVVCAIDKKTYVISIAVKAQDPLICATVADSTCQRLQQFITEYRTKKARIEYDHMLEQYQKARAEYDAAKEAVAAYNDANWDLVEEEFVVQKQSLQNEMSLRFSALSNVNSQLLAARAKLDEARPVFTVLDGASVPLRPAGPKKSRFVLGFVFLVCLVQTLWILRKDLRHIKLPTQSEPTNRVHLSRRR